MPTITKRRFMAVAAGTVVGTTFLSRGAAAADLPPNERELYEAAKKEGEVTWYQGQYQSETSEAIGRAFSERFPGLKVNVVRSTSQVAFQRISQDIRAGVAQCDVLSSTDTSHFTYLKREGRLAKFRPKNADGLIEAIRRVDPDDTYTVSYLTLFLIGTNARKVPEAEAPHTWKELLDPKWKNQLAVGHPGFSGAIGGWCVMMRKMYGVEFFKALEKNKPQIGRSSQDPVTLMEAGERNVGVAVPSSGILLSRSRGNPLLVIYPTDGSLLIPGPSGIPKNAPHPNAARLFMEFVTGPTYSEVASKYFETPLRPETPLPEGAKPVSSVKTISTTAEELEAGIPEVKELWRDTFGV